MDNFLKEYEGKTIFTKKEAKSIFIKFLMIHGVLQDYAKCYNLYHIRCGDYTFNKTVKDTIESTINYILKNGINYCRLFLDIPASFSWSIDNIVKWENLNKIWCKYIKSDAKIVNNS